MNSGAAMAAFYGDGVLNARDLASGITGAVVKDPVQDRVVWQEYLQTVVKERDGWGDFYRLPGGVVGINYRSQEIKNQRAARLDDVWFLMSWSWNFVRSPPAMSSHATRPPLNSSASAITAPGAPGRWGRRWTEYRPDAVLIEGPPEANDLIPLLGGPGLRPARGRVGALRRTTRRTRRSSRWRSIPPNSSPPAGRVDAGAEVEFIDLPMTHRLRLERRNAEGRRSPERSETARDRGREDGDPTATRIRFADPLGWLARAAGYDDRERWWEQQVEQRRDAAGLFEAIAEAMTELRTGAEATSLPASAPATAATPSARPYMRRRVRAAVKAGRHRKSPSSAGRGTSRPSRTSGRTSRTGNY